ncbi:hypothetical protein MUK42_15353 [Musa troglodytarum]|uniref:Uncharacterized protein n=1 Tax=Musa troglodytarum TaxID=320322 RepID=A0A9E7H244_9LILI|nr:hypothetical protein MUK42_11819 [Musa troglodytarum]URE25388.1 hypothetical protein MUK42_15353 [Musa troglodytarum]
MLSGEERVEPRIAPHPEEVALTKPNPLRGRNGTMAGPLLLMCSSKAGYFAKKARQVTDQLDEELGYLKWIKITPQSSPLQQERGKLHNRKPLPS